jgi:hypothetical protein
MIKMMHLLNLASNLIIRSRILEEAETLLNCMTLRGLELESAL